MEQFIEVQSNDNDQGIGIDEMSAAMSKMYGMTEKMVIKLVEKLTNDGIIYSTVDESTFKHC